MSVYSVNVYPSSTTIQKDHWYYDAYAVVSASSDCYKDVEWYSDKPSVATVNESNGYIWGCSPGVARIYARSTFDSSKQDCIIVHVTNDPICVESVSLDASNFSIRKGRQFVLSATVYPENASNKSIAWSSSDESVATVSEGVVTAKSKGDTYIYAVAQDGSGMYDTCYVKVTENILVSSITLNHSSYTLNANGSVLLRATVCPTNATNDCVEWSSNKPHIAFVNPDSGFVTAQGTGTAIITARAQDGSGKYAECTITVTPPVAVTGVEVYPTSLTMNVGDTDYLCKTIYPSNATNQTVTWCSSDDSVAEINTYSGKITAKKAGTTTITATTADGGFQDCMTINVNYCGGSNYRDVTKHNMMLCNDGYYVCTRCGYKVQSPELQDRQILSGEDYLKVFSCLMFYAYLEVYRQKFPSVSDFELSQNTAMQLVTEIRQKNIYANRYSYSDGNGQCLGPNIDYNHMFSFVELRDLNIFNIGNFNGLNNSINDLVIGIFCPSIAMTQNILDLITHQMNGIDFSAMVLDLCGYSNIANGLSMVSAVMDATNTGINTDDQLIVVRLNNAIQGNFIFSPDNKFKMVKYTN